MTVGTNAQWWYRLGGPNAITLSAWLLTLPGAVLTAPALVQDPSWPQVLAWFLLGGVAHVLCGGVLLGARLTVLGPGPRTARPLAFVAVVIIAGIVRGLFMGLVAVEWGLTDSANLPLRLIAAPFVLLVWLSLATLIVDGTRRHRDAMEASRLALDRERELVAESASRLRRRRAEIVAQLAQVVRVQLEAAAALTDDPRRAAEHLQRIVEEVVRPLSRQLEQRSMQDDQLLTGVERIGTASRVPLREYVGAVFACRPFAPLLTGALVLGTSTILIFYSLGPLAGAACLAVDVLSVVGLSAIARATITPRLAGWRPRRRIIVVTGVVVAAGALNGTAFAICLAWTGFASPAEDLGSSAAFAAMAAAVAVAAQSAAAAFGAVTVLRIGSETTLRSATEAAERAHSRLGQRAFIEQQDLSRIIHGDVQARIVSLALQLQLDPPADSAAAVAELERRIQQSLGERPRSSWRGDVDELVELWAHAIDLTVDIESAAAARLDADLSAAQAVVAVTREAITNAVRHGAADRVAVRVRLGAEVIELEVRDDGVVDPSTRTSGMGMRVYDAVCLDWDLEVGAQGQLTARIATGSADGVLVGGWDS